MELFVPSNQNQYILVVIDYVSKWVEATSIPTNDAKVAVKFLKKNIFIKFGTPRAIISDEGSIFSIKHSMLFVLGVKHRVATTHHPQANGYVEILTEKPREFWKTL